MKNIISLLAITFFVVFLSASCHKENQDSASLVGDWQYLDYDPTSQDQITFTFNADGTICTAVPGLPTVCGGTWEQANPGDESMLFIMLPGQKICSLWQVETLAPDIVGIISLTDNWQTKRTDYEKFTLIRNNVQY